jgi:selenophosphate synthase
VHPVGPSGLLAISALAELINAAIAIRDVPMTDPETSAFATKEFLVENSTASLNGCHIMVASSAAIALISEDLRKHNFSPQVIGTVQKKGAPSVSIDPQVAEKYIASKPKLARLTSAPAPA